MPLEDVGELTLKGLTQPVVAFNACRSRLPHRPSVSSKEAHRAFDWGRCAPSPSNPPMAEMGHEDPFPRPVPNGRCRFGQENFAGVRGNGREAPILVIR